MVFSCQGVVTWLTLCLSCCSLSTFLEPRPMQAVEKANWRRCLGHDAASSADIFHAHHTFV